MTIDRSGCAAPRHGTASAYSFGRCRCADARRASRYYRGAIRYGLNDPAWVDNTGVVRRRRALAAIGWSLTDLAPYFGTTWQTVGMHAAGDRVRRDTLDRWRAVYEQLSMTIGPSRQAREYAQRQGWAPPLAWDDDTIDDPDASPEGLRLCAVHPEADR